MISRIALAAVLFSMCACAKGQIIDTQPTGDTCVSCTTDPTTTTTTTTTSTTAPTTTTVNCLGGMILVNGSGGCPISAAQVFSNVPATWQFQNAYGDMTWIDIAPQLDGSTIWHYTKNNCRAYWTPGACSAELYFNLTLINGRWYSTGGHILFPFGAPWDPTPLDLVYTVFPDVGMPLPYMIIADSGTVDDTTFPDPTPGTRWLSKMYNENGELISEQWEGSCVHEKWHFAVGKGLVKVEPLDLGSCVPADPNLVMVRIN